MVKIQCTGVGPRQLPGKHLFKFCRSVIGGTRKKMYLPFFRSLFSASFASYIPLLYVSKCPENKVGEFRLWPQH